MITLVYITLPLFLWTGMQPVLNYTFMDYAILLP